MLSYDNEGRLAGWQNTPTSPTTTDSFLYDGEGNRVEQQTTTNGSIITSTVYVAGGLEEITSSGATTTLTKYFGAAGLPTAERVGTNGPVSYLASDGQGTVSETLDGSGNVTSAQLYTPYGSVRYSSGSSPTSLGYTGQRADSTTGLDYYHARYYDPVAGQFTSADTVQDGLNRYGYVAGNPTTATDPSGHRRMCEEDCGTPKPPKQTDCHATHTCKTTDDGKKGDGTPVSCRDDENQGDGSPCNDWRKWRDNMSGMKGPRETQLAQERDTARNLVISGIVVLLLGAVAVMFGPSDPVHILDIVISIAETVIDIFGWLATADPAHSATDYDMLSKMSGTLAVADTLLALIHGLAWWALWTIQPVFTLLKLTIEGLPGLILSLALGAVGFALQAGGQALVALGASQFADIANQESMPIWDWCAGPGKGQCSTEPNGGMPDAK